MGFDLGRVLTGIATGGFSEVGRALSPDDISAPILPDTATEFGRALEEALRLQPKQAAAREADIAAGLETFRQFAPQQLQAELDVSRQFAPQFQDLGTMLANLGIRDDISAVEQFGPQLRQAVATADPETERIRSALAEAIFGDLEAGGGLTARETRDSQQDIRAAQTARGITRGNAPVREEGLFVGRERDARRRQRLNAAQSFLQTQAQTQIDPFTAITGRTATRQVSPFLGNTVQLPQGGTNELASQLAGSQGQRNILQAQLGFGADSLNAENQLATQQALFGLIGQGVGGFLGRPV